jgi:hypothetical protein
MEIVCNITEESVAISNNLLSCKGQNTTLSLNEQVRIVGSTSVNSISVRDSSVTIELLLVTIESQLPFTSIHSNVTVVQSGRNELLASGLSQSGIDCSEFTSYVFLTSSAESSLIASGDGGGSGIGSGINGTCDSLRFINGSYTASGGTGIGSASSMVFDNSRVGHIWIESGTFIATGSNGGSGIGSGASTGGASHVGGISILDGNIAATTAAGGTALGSGSASGGTSKVDITDGSYGSGDYFKS